MKKMIVLAVTVVLALGVFAFAGCGGSRDLENRVAELERQIEQGLKGDRGPQGPKGDTGPQGPGGSGLVGNDTPDKVHELGDTVAYYHNGLKLFEITVIGMSDTVGGGRTGITFIFTPFSFYLETDLGNFLGAKLVDDDSQAINNSTGISNFIDGSNHKQFVINTSSIIYGQKTLYLCIASVNMYIPFAVYNLNFTASP
ncbi:MAG: collagen-like protein [Firmicutes bacterium]|nr:collagen-like protein [Bacillota bacterium]